MLKLLVKSFFRSWHILLEVRQNAVESDVDFKKLCYFTNLYFAIVSWNFHYNSKTNNVLII